MTVSLPGRSLERSSTTTTRNDNYEGEVLRTRSNILINLLECERIKTGNLATSQGEFSITRGLGLVHHEPFRKHSQKLWKGEKPRTIMC